MLERVLLLPIGVATGLGLGLGLAEMLARDGCQVRLVVNGTVAGQTIPQYARDKWLGDLHKLGVETVTHTSLFVADEDTVFMQHVLIGEAVVLRISGFYCLKM